MIIEGNVAWDPSSLVVLRHRASLLRLSTQLRNRIHAVAADHGYDRRASY